MNRVKLPSKFLKLIFLSALVFVFIGCSADEPLQPSMLPVDNPDPSELTGKNALDDNHLVLGLWHVVIDPDSRDVSVIPARTSDLHHNVSPLFKPGLCPTCLVVDLVDVIPGDFLTVDVQLTHPYPGEPWLDAFDPKIVILGLPGNNLIFPSGSVSDTLLNGDGFTTRWSYGQWAQINGFIDLEKGDPERRFASGETTEAIFELDIEDTGLLALDFVVDVSWIAPEFYNPDDPLTDFHQNEAYDVQPIENSEILPVEGAVTEIEVEFSDWQDDGGNASVTFEIPALSDAISEGVLIENGDKVVFTCEITNDKNPAPGNYIGLICIRDLYNDSLDDSRAVFQTVEITVTDSIPPITGIEITPEAISIPEAGQGDDFDLWWIFEGGSKIPVADTIDWSIEGISLADHALADIDSDGTVTRLSSKWWGGIATVTAKIAGYEAHATVFCDDPFADSASVEFGALNEEGNPYTMPSSLPGPPNCGGSNTVCALGYGGTAILEFTDNVIINGPGVDFITFENAFIVNGSGCDWYGETRYAVWNETAIIEASRDGENWYRFPFDYNPDNTSCVPYAYMDPASFTGLAGNWPTYCGVDPDGTLLNGIDPTDPSTAGGNAFDLDDIGLDWCSFVKIIDTGDPDYPGTETYDSDGDLILCYGNVSPLGAVPNVAGHDADAVAAVHSASPLAVK